MAAAKSAVPARAGSEGGWATLDETWAYATIAELAAAQARGDLTATALVTACLERIAALDRAGPVLAAVIETNPEAVEIAAALDAERHSRGPRGPLHGIPVLVKDNIDTADRMMTTAGSLALVGPAPARDATVVARLRAAGAIVLGKANLSEWANFRGRHSTSGWSARGGQCRNPHDPTRGPSGSSSGSAAAVAAGMVPVALGTETDGSIVSPAGACGVVGLKPTVGRTSRAGVIPIAFSQDSVGPLARTVADAACVLAVLAAPDPGDPATVGAGPLELERALAPDGLRGARLGVPRHGCWGQNRHADRVGDAALTALRAAGATIVDPAEIPTMDEMNADGSEYEVMLHEFHAGLDTYLAGRRGLEVHSLEDVIAFNEAHAAQELRRFGQEHLIAAAPRGDLTTPAYRQALARSRDVAGRRGLDAVLDALGLDALVAPTAGPAAVLDPVWGDRNTGGCSSPAARAGYPLLSVPAGLVQGMPVNITLMGRAGAEETLLRLGLAIEALFGPGPRPRLGS